MAQIQTVIVDAIDHNPFRNVGSYPFVERKVEALRRSIKDVGLWEGIIVRPAGNRYEMAFGHHRLEAARRNDMREVPVIIRNLTDEEMLGFMGRENMEDFNADFLCMLETWEAAVKFKSPSRDGELDHPVDIAILLGWTQARTDSIRPQMNRTADACNAAHALLKAGHIQRDDLVDLTVNEVREICTRAAANIQRIQTAGKAMGTSAKHIEEAKEAIGKAVKTTADESRGGKIAKKDLRGRVDLNAYRHAHAPQHPKASPLFSVFGKMLASSLRKMLNEDRASAKLEEVIRLVPIIVNHDDKLFVQKIEYELDEIAERAIGFRRRLTDKKNKVAPFPMLTGKGA